MCPSVPTNPKPSHIKPSWARKQAFCMGILALNKDDPANRPKRSCITCLSQAQSSRTRWVTGNLPLYWLGPKTPWSPPYCHPTLLWDCSTPNVTGLLLQHCHAIFFISFFIGLSAPSSDHYGALLQHHSAICDTDRAPAQPAFNPWRRLLHKNDQQDQRSHCHCKSRDCSTIKPSSLQFLWGTGSKCKH